MKFPMLLVSAALILGILSVRARQVSADGASSAAPRTVNAASCNLVDVQRALDQAHVGDTVAIPAGTCTWTSTLTVSTAVNLLGSATGTTTIIDNVDRSH